MSANAPPYADDAMPGIAPEANPGVQATETLSLTDSIVRLLRDVLDLLELESRAAALTLALIVFCAVAAACFAMFAWFGLSAIGVFALVQAGMSLGVALTALAAINGGLAIGAGLLVQHLTKSIMFGNRRERRLERATERSADA